DWSNNIWSAQISGGWFVETCTKGTSSTGPCAKSGSPQSDSLAASLQYVDWSGVKWTASRAGGAFVSTKADAASTDGSCRAAAGTGISAFPPGSTSFENCLSYVSTSIPLTDATGNHVTVSFAPQGAPVFTTPSTLSFFPSVASTQTITAS